MGKKYANPPIVEAVCEFRLPSDSQWDLTIPGFIYEKVKADFPHREQRLFQEVDLQTSEEGVRQQVRTTERVLFFSEDRKTFIQIGHHLLAINRLKPYPHWEKFKPHVANVFQALVDTVAFDTLHRIGLRYINRIEIQAMEVPLQLDEYFNFRPTVGPVLEHRPAKALLVGSVFSFADERDACKVEFTNAVAEQSKTAFMLDLDYFLAKPQAVSSNQAMDWVEDAHQQVEDIFEGCITQKLRDSFEEIK